MLFHVNETSGLDVCGARLKGDWAVGVGGEKIWPPGLVCDTVWWAACVPTLPLCVF
jgi:hypothetical protein